MDRADVILFAPGPTGAVSEVSVERGEVRHITELDRPAGELRHVRPTSLPDGRHFVYLANRKDGPSPPSHRPTEAPSCRSAVRSHVEATPSGDVLFVRDGSLLAQRLDVAAGRLTGDATVVADGLSPREVLRWQVLGIACNAHLPEGEELPTCPSSGSSIVRGRRRVPLGARRVCGTEPVAGWHASGRGPPRTERPGPGYLGVRPYAWHAVRLTLDPGDDLEPSGRPMASG